MSVKVSPHIHDLNFELNDSCNCCCWNRKKAPMDEDQIFIRRDGTFEKFSYKKSRDIVEANRVTILRLEKRIEELSKIIKVESPMVKNNVKETTGFTIDKDKPNSLSYGQLKKINSVFLQSIEKKN